MTTKNPDYTRPSVKTLDAREVVESLGPVSAGSGNRKETGLINGTGGLTRD